MSIVLSVFILLLLSFTNALYRCTSTIIVAARSMAWVCGRSLAEIAGSNPAVGMNVCLFRVLCVVR